MKSFLKEWKYTILTGVGILIFAFLIRLYNLTLLPVFADEAIYIRWSQIMSAEPTLRFLPLSDGKQPFYMWVLMFVVGRVSDPLFAGRVLSVVSGIGSIVGIFAVSYLLFKNKLVSLVSSFIWTISPFSFFFDRMALVDSFLACFTIWTLFFAVLTSKTKRLDTAIITGFALGFALLTKSPAIFTVLLIPTTWIFIKKPRDLFRLVPFLFVTYVVGYAMYNILRLGPNFHLVGSRNQDYIFPISHLWINPKDPFIFHIEQIFKDWFVKMGPWPILGLAVVGFLASFKRYWKETLLLLAWFLFPVLVQSMYAKVFTVRYILFTFPPLFILAASGFLQKKKLFLIFYSFLMVLFIGTALYFDYQLLTNLEKANLPSSERSGYLEEWTNGTGIKEVSDYLKAQNDKNPSEKIVVGTEGYFGTLPDGLQMYVQGITNITVIGTGLDFGEVPQSLIDSFKAGNKTYFVVNSSRLKIKEENFEKNGLKVIAKYVKSDRREKDTHEFLWYGPHDTFYFFQLVELISPKD
ncbi:MAG: glycosyltransferase family 39 protein [Patescibacteria group bacterium]